ncbi:hypothetical protein [Nocardia sp. NPDC050175]|uniref:hypothetical protein n=1 Tax=Nocardia sp. NPDC050175 TaxID=3364317 RepID=UPI00379ED84D
MAVAAGQVSSDLSGEFRTPSFDNLLGDAAGMPWATPAEAPRPTLRAAGVLAGALARAQLRLLPRPLVPLTVIGFVGCVLLALITTRSGSPPAIFGLAVTLVFQLGTLAACMPETDPRLELFSTLPIAPAVVFAGRLAVVFAADTALAVLTSIVASEVGGAAAFPAMVAGWLGPAMFASAAGIVCAVWRSTAVGAVVGAAIWLLGVAESSSAAGPVHRIGALIEPLWSTSTATLVITALLLIAAVAGMRRPRYNVAAA